MMKSSSFRRRHNNNNTVATMQQQQQQQDDYDYDMLRRGQREAQQRGLMETHETTMWLREIYLLLQQGTTTDALWLVNFMNSLEKTKLVDTLKRVLRDLHLATHDEVEKELLSLAVRVCYYLASDVQLATLYGSCSESDSLISLFHTFCQDAEFICSHEDNNNMNDILLATQVLQVKDALQRTLQNKTDPHNVETSLCAIPPNSSQQQQSNEEYYKHQLGPLRFDLTDQLWNYKFQEQSMVPPSFSETRRWFKELSTYKSILPVEYGSSILVRSVETKLNQLRVIIMGPEKTPYAHGAFVFDVLLPPSYPQVPPLVHFLSTGNGKVRFNPNLYANGKVCLSLLGTWNGPSWIPGTSTLLQVLISIQSLILVPDPYFNEPGYESQLNTREGKRKSALYNQQLRKQTLQLCIINILEELVHPNQPQSYPEFAQVLIKHFLVKKQVLEQQVSEWTKRDGSLKKLKKRLSQLLDQLDKLHPGIAVDGISGVAATNKSHVATLPDLKPRNLVATSTATQQQQQPLAQLPSYREAPPSRDTQLPYAQMPQNHNHHETNHASYAQNNREMANNNNRAPGLTVKIPPNIRPGDEFEVLYKGQIHYVTCPPHGQAGKQCEVLLQLKPPRAESPPMEEAKVCKIGGRYSGYIVTIPPNTSPGDSFHVKIRGSVMAITCPPHGRPGAPVKIFPPPQHEDNIQQQDVDSDVESEEEEDETFTVMIPPGVGPGSHFAINKNGIRLVLKCPRHASAGQVVRYRITMLGTTTAVDDEPTTTTQQQREESQETPSNNNNSRVTRVEAVRHYAPTTSAPPTTLVTIRYASTSEWVRVLLDGNFCWNKGNQQDFGGNRGEGMRSYTCARDLIRRDLPGGHSTGELCLVPVGVAGLESTVKNSQGQIVASPQDISEASAKLTMQAKVDWFRGVCAQHLRVPMTQGHIILKVRRGDYMLDDSVKSIMMLSSDDLRKRWRLRYVGDAFMDSTEENQWYQHVVRKLFDPDLGLYQYSQVENELRMQIHPASGFCCEDHLQYFRFGGRILGKALLEGKQILTAPLDTYIFKLLVGWPIHFRDLQSVDGETYRHLEQLDSWKRSGEDVSVFGLNFATTRQVLDRREDVELIPGGFGVELTNENFQLYLESSLRYRLIDSVKPQLTELLLGVFDVIPEALLAAFDYKEFEQLITYH